MIILDHYLTTRLELAVNGGGGEIRTHGPFNGTTV